VTTYPTSFGASAAPPVARKARRNYAVAAWRILVLLIVVAIWAVAATRLDVVPSVGETAASLWEGVVTEGYFLGPLWNTLRAILTGFVIATVLGLATGIVLGRSRFWGAVGNPILSGLFATPRVILYPALLAAFGVSLTAEIWLATIVAYFPIAINATAGMRDVNPTLVRLGRSLNCSRLQLIRHIVVPTALPAILVGVRLSLSMAFLGVLIAELFAGSGDVLGQLLMRAYGLQQYAPMFAIVILVTVIAFAANLMMWSLERKVEAVVS
jgi:NitT/TauT family transport system permease protein